MQSKELTFSGIGFLIAGSIFTLIAVTVLVYRWKLVLVCIRGETAIGEVVRLNVDSKSGHVHPRISFTVSSGSRPRREPLSIASLLLN